MGVGSVGPIGDVAELTSEKQTVRGTGAFVAFILPARISLPQPGHTNHHHFVM